MNLKNFYNYWKCLAFIFILIIVGISPATAKKKVSTDGAPKAIGTYSQAIKSRNLLYISGQIAINPVTSQLDTSSIETETKQVMSNIGEILKADSLGFDNIVNVTIYLTNLDNFAKVNEIYGAYFKIDPPARATVQVVRLPKGAHIEIVAVAEH